jgi:hypothetical protein
VAIATHKGGLYLQDQLDRLLEQELAALELVMADDGCKNDTVLSSKIFRCMYLVLTLFYITVGMFKLPSIST